MEERDPKYDAMLGQMIGRVTSKPGGKAEMGEVSFCSILISCKICYVAMFHHQQWGSFYLFFMYLF